PDSAGNSSYERTSTEFIGILKTKRKTEMLGDICHTARAFVEWIYSTKFHPVVKPFL
ncbi:hypothetical protein WA026_009082, partial [Henosepilachna vigintioctopunctata]